MSLIYLAGIMRLVYYGFFLFYYRKLFPPKNESLLPTISAILLIFTAHFLPPIRSMPMSSLPIMLILIIVGLRLSTGMNWWQAIHGGSMCVLYTCCFCGIVAELSIVFSQNHIALKSTQIRLLAFPATLLFFILLRKFLLNDKKHKQFLESMGHPKLVIILEVLAAINFSVIYLGRFGLSDIWNLAMALFASVLTVSVLVYSILYTIKSAESMEAKWEQKMLEKQFEKQLQHYTICQNHTKSFRAFRHDYKALMASLKPLIVAGEKDEAIQLIDNIYEEMDKRIKAPKKFSGFIVLDAILQDVANICEKNEISYTFHLFLPGNTRLSQLNRIRILTNVVNNAIDACLNVPKEERFLAMTSRVDEQWVTLEVRNSYAGNLKFDHGRPLTTKQESEIHGLGLQGVHEIAEELGGFVCYDIDQEKHIFLIRIHIPKAHEHMAL